MTIYPGLLISGGDGWIETSFETSAELIIIHFNGSLELQELPTLPTGRSGHTSNGNIICGGEEEYPHLSPSNIPDVCIQLSENKSSWSVTSHNLKSRRRGHCSGTYNVGILLLGGIGDEDDASGHPLHPTWKAELLR